VLPSDGYGYADFVFGIRRFYFFFAEAIFHGKEKELNDSLVVPAKTRSQDKYYS
jgi:hypothetical protein